MLFLKPKNETVSVAEQYSGRARESDKECLHERIVGSPHFLRTFLSFFVLIFGAFWLIFHRFFRFLQSCLRSLEGFSTRVITQISSTHAK